MASNLEELVREDPEWAKRTKAAIDDGFSADEIESNLRSRGVIQEVSSGTGASWTRPVAVAAGGILGGSAGGLLGAPTGPGALLSGIAGAAGGSALGGQLHDLMANLLHGAPKESLGAAARRITGDVVGDAATGATGEMTGQILNKVAGSVAGAYRGRRAAQIAEASDAADLAAKHGVPLSASEVSLSPSVRRIENAPTYFATGAGPVRAMRDAALERAKRSVGEVGESLATTGDDAMGVGMRAQDDAKALLGKWRQTKSALFQSVERTVGDAPVIGTEGFREVAKDLAQTNPPAGLTPLARKAWELAATQEQIPFKAARQLEAELGAVAFNKPGAIGTIPQGQAAALRGAVHDAIDEFLTATPEAGDTLAEAKQVYSTGKELFNGAAQRLVTGTRRSPRGAETVIQRVFRPGQITDTLDFKQLVSDDTYATATRTWLDGLVEKATKNGEFVPSAFARAVKPYVDSGHLGVILPPEQAKSLTELATIFDRMGKAERLAANPSGTAQALTGVGQLGLAASRLLSGNMLGAGKILAGPYAAGKAVTSDAGQRLLTKVGTEGMVPSLMDLFSPQMWETVGQSIAGATRPSPRKTKAPGPPPRE